MQFQAVVGAVQLESVKILSQLAPATLLMSDTALHQILTIQCNLDRWKISPHNPSAKNRHRLPARARKTPACAALHADFYLPKVTPSTPEAAR